MHVVDDEKIKFPYCTSINNGHMKVKITFTWYLVSDEKNSIFEIHYPIIWKA